MIENSEFEKCRSCVCFAVRRAARAVTQHYEKALRPYGLRATQFNVLALLAQTGPLPMARLADMLGLDRTSLTRNLQPLIRQRRVSAEEDADDRRIRMVRVTPAGLTSIRKALPAWRKAQATVGTVLDGTGVAVRGVDGVTNTLNEGMGTEEDTR